MATNGNNSEPSEEDFQELKDRCKVLFEADPSQSHSDLSLKRFLRAFGDVDFAFKMLLKCNKWRYEFGVERLSPEDDDIAQELTTNKVLILRQRDMAGRPVVYMAVRRHNAYERDIERLTKFIVYILENACKKCNEDVIDNLCIVFDMKDFAMANMDYQFIKSLIWLLSRYYPERLGVCLILNAPMVFYGCWTVIRRWLNDVTASKVKFANGDTELAAYLHPDMLPSD